MYQSYIFRLRLNLDEQEEACATGSGTGDHTFIPMYVWTLSVIASFDLTWYHHRNTLAVGASYAKLHHSTVHGLCARYPSLADAIRLVSLWAANHMFSGESCFVVPSFFDLYPKM